MNELHNVRKRIQGRRYQEPKKHNGIFKIVYRTSMLVMLVAVLTLACFINDKVGFVDIPVDFKNLNFGMVSEWLPFDQWFSKSEDETVNAALEYSLLKENQYTNGTNKVTMLADGVVLHVEDNGPQKSSVSVRHDTGVIATYGHLDSVQINQDERLLKGTAIATCGEYVSIDLVKDNEVVDMKTAFSEE